MGKSTGNLCLSKLCFGIVNSPKYSQLYLRLPTKSDTRRIVQLHKDNHGIDGMLGSLDVTKIHWANCPCAWKGQFEGKEGSPTIRLEAVADYNLWIWHSAFGFPGSMNDLNIWERSPLLETMIDGYHDSIDHNFIINGQSFKQLYYLIDGIYPLLSRFVPTISDPSTKLDQQFLKKQESFRKSIERAFGILKRKFLALSTGMRFYDKDDIFYIVKCAVVFHNMMVEERICSDEIECEDNYLDISTIHQSDQHEQMSDVSTDDENPTVNPTVTDSLHVMADYSFKYKCAVKKWNELYDVGNAIKLQDALKRQLYKNSNGDDELIDFEAISDDFDPLNF